MAQETTDQNFENDVLKSDLPVLVDFWAPWCGPCRMLGPIIDIVAERAAGTVRVYKVNVDDNPATATRYNVTGIPTVILFKGGEVLKEFVGLRPEKTYLDAVA
jgi:thioredoxin 1